jgi:hypothetical protein
VRESSTLPSPDAGRTADPPRAVSSVPAGVRGRLAQIEAHPPAWLRVPAKSVGIGFGAGVASFSAMALPAAVGLIPGEALPSMAVWVTLGTAWAAFTYRLLRSLGKRHPFLTGQLHAALLVVPAMSALIRWDFAAVESSGFWLTTAIGSGVIGCILGRVYESSAPPPIAREAGRSED